MESNRAPGIVQFCITVLCSTESCIAFMRKVGMLKTAMVCGCGCKMKITKRNDISDKQIWICTNNMECFTRISIRTGSFFEKSKLPLNKILMMMYCFAIDLQVYQCHKLEPQLDENTITTWYGYFRDVCSSAMLRKPVKLGTGLSTDIIEIDESLFGKKRKYNKGSGNQKYWVFGMIERETKKSVLQLVDRRDKNTLIPIIRRYVETGSTIYSDMWGAYNDLEGEGYTHKAVNHSEEFVSKEGCCTNTIEGLWGLVKLRIKKMKGILPCKLPAIIDEFMYRHRFGFSNGDIFDVFISDLVEFEEVK